LNKPILEIKNLTITLPKNADRSFAVENADLDVFKGEILFIVGESGSGKSVMTSAILNDVPASLKVTSGSIVFKNQDILKLSQRELNKLRGAKISMIYQEPMAALNPSIRVGKQVDEVFALHRPEIKAEHRKSETLKLLDEMKLPNPERIYSSYAHQVSGGQCQRIVIAMALACKPDILIADEPTTALDVTTQAEILKLISDLKEIYKNTIIFITHDFGVVADVADRVVVMCQGKIIEKGSKKDILMKPREPYTQLLVDAMPLLETTRAPDKGRTDLPSVEVNSLHKIYKTRSNQVHAVNDASFVLRKGETLGVVGESGSGKSTLAKTLIRLEEPTSGTVKIREEDFLSLSGRDLISSRKKIQMIFQDPFGSLNPSQTVGFMLTRGLELQGVGPVEAKERAYKLLKQVGLGEQSFKRKPQNFSGGQRQRIGIARALSMGPDVILADECVSALDLSVQKQVLLLLNRLQSTYNMAIIFITHDLRVAAQVSDYIAVMEKGNIVEFGTAEDVFNKPKDEYTKKLLDAAPGKNWHPPRLDPEEAERIAKSLEVTN
jgi:peptide/nickel transport system ATP-binding protein